MKNSTAIMIVAVLLVCAMLPICLVSCGKVTALQITPQLIHEINYNNYLEENCFDYKGETIAWDASNSFQSSLVVRTGNNEQLELDDVCSPFQLVDGGVVYRKDHALMYVDFDTKKHNSIIEGIDRFIVYDNSVIYYTVIVTDDRSGEHWNELRKYNLSLKTNVSVYDGVTEFYIHNESLFVVNKNNMLLEISLDGDEEKEIISLPEKAYPLLIMPQGERLLYAFAGSMFILDISTGIEERVIINETTHVNDKVSFICDDSHIFVSFQATKTDGSVVKKIDGNNNGLWSIDLETFQKDKICSEVFDRLYLFGDSLLFGTINDDLYRINIASKYITKITE